MEQKGTQKVYNLMDTLQRQALYDIYASNVSSMKWLHNKLVLDSKWNQKEYFCNAPRYHN